MIGRPLVKSFRFLKERIMNPIKHYIFPKQFTFITLPPQQNLEFKSFPVEEWHFKKSEQSQTYKVKLLSLFLIFFFIGDWVYTMKHNQNVMYYYYINYPLAMKLIETNIYHFESVFKPFVEIIPKQKYEIPQVWDRLQNALFNTHQNQIIKDQNLQKLKAQIAEIDQKLI